MVFYLLLGGGEKEKMDKTTSVKGYDKLNNHVD